MKRERNLDIARGIAIIFMVIGHCYSQNNIVLTWIYAFHMPFFFVISGALHRGKKFDIIHQLRRTFIPYFSFEILYAVFLAALNFKDAHFTVFYASITKTILLKGNSATWFLPCLFLTKVLFELSKKAGRFQLCIVTVLFISAFFLPPDWPLIVLARSLIGLGFYTAGVYGQNLLKQHINAFALVVMLVFYCISAKFNGMVSLYSLDFSYRVLYTINGLIGSYLLIKLSQCLAKCTIRVLSGVICALTYFGENTIIILCTHKFAIEILRIIDSKLLDGILLQLGIVEGVLFGLIVCLIEIPIVYFGSRYFNILFGMPSQKKQTNNQSA